MVVKRLLNGRFQFIRVVSTKHYSKTYLMADHNDPTHPKCIVKHLQLPSRNPITLKFLAELLNKRVTMLRRLGENEGIADTLLAMQEGQDFYWVRPYITGQSLQVELISQQSKPERFVRDLLQELLTLLDFIQEQGIVHQNLQPSNIIRRNDHRLVLVDFSLVHESDQPQSYASMNGKAPDPLDPSVYLPPMKHRRFSRFNADHFAVGMIALQYATGLATEALPHVNQPDFLEQVKLQLDECSTLNDPLKQVLMGMVRPQPEKQFHRAKDILALLSGASLPTEGGVASRAEADTAGKSSPASKHFLGLGLAVLTLLLGLGLWGFRIPTKLQAAWLNRQAQTAEKAGETDAALDYLTQIIQLQPHQGEALAQRSEIRWQQGNSELALKDLTDAIQAEPESPIWPFKRGNLRFRLGDLQGAISDYTNALELDPGYGDAYVNRGSARAERGDESGAIEDYTAAIKRLQEPEKLASAHLNRCLSQSNLNHQTEALADCTEAINLRPNNSLAYENRGLVKRRLNDLQGALQDFTIAIQIAPDSAEPFYNRGLTRQELGDTAGALQDFNQTVALNPDHPFVHYDRGLIYAQQGERQKAIADLKIAASTCLELGRLGCFNDAQYQLQQLQAPDSPDAAVDR